MTTAEFYRRAQTDPGFRRTELDNLRYYRSVGAGLGWTLVVIAIGMTLYGGVTDHSWFHGVSVCFDAGLCWTVQRVCVRRIARLERMDVGAE